MTKIASFSDVFDFTLVGDLDFVVVFGDRMIGGGETRVNLFDEISAGIMDGGAEAREEKIPGKEG